MSHGQCTGRPTASFPVAEYSSTFWLVPNYTASRQRHMYLDKLLRVSTVHEVEHTESNTANLPLTHKSDISFKNCSAISNSRAELSPHTLRHDLKTDLYSFALRHLQVEFSIPQLTQITARPKSSYHRQ